MNDKSSKEKAHHLAGYLIFRFIIVMACIYFANMLITPLIRNVMWPGINNLFMVDEIDFPDLGLVQMVGIILVLLVNGTISRIPGLKLIPVGSWLAQAFDIQTSVPQDVSDRGDIAIAVYSIILLVAVLIVIILSLLPYILGCIWYVLVVIRKMDEVLEYDRNRTREYDRQRNLMLSDMAHDIKTPITAMSGYAQALNDGLVPPEKQPEYLNSIYNKAMRVSELINMMFEYIKLDSAGYELHMTQGDVAELCRQVAAELYQDFEEAGLELIPDIPEQICTRDMDYLQMTRVVTNLCTNAIKYVDKGNRVLLKLKIIDDSSYVPVIEGKDEKRHKGYEISVADTGDQIDDDLAACIFTPFTRGDKTRSTKGGTGLGLSIAHKIVELHGGELILDRNPGEGYTKAFVIKI